MAGVDPQLHNIFAEMGGTGLGVFGPRGLGVQGSVAEDSVGEDDGSEGKGADAGEVDLTEEFAGGTDEGDAGRIFELAGVLPEDEEDGRGGREGEGVGEVMGNDATVGRVLGGVALAGDVAQFAEGAIGTRTQNGQRDVGNPIAHGSNQVGRVGGKRTCPG